MARRHRRTAIKDVERERHTHYPTFRPATRTPTILVLRATDSAPATMRAGELVAYTLATRVRVAAAPSGCGTGKPMCILSNAVQRHLLRRSLALGLQRRVPWTSFGEFVCFALS